MPSPKSNQTVLNMNRSLNTGRPQNKLLSSGSIICTCCGACCPCLNLKYFGTFTGILKIVQVVLASACQYLISEYAVQKDERTFARAYQGLQAIASGCFFTNLLLIVCYILSERNIHYIQQTLFEIFFNGIAFFLYLSSSVFFSMKIGEQLGHLHSHEASIYGELNFAYHSLVYIGMAVAVMHGFDALIAIKQSFFSR